MTTPIAALAKIVGWKAELARILGVTRQSVSRWEAEGSPTREPGHMPTEYNPVILSWARENGVSQRRVKALLDARKGVRKNGA